MAKKQFKCNVCGYIHEGASAPDTCPVCGVAASEFTEQKAARKGFDTNSNAYIVIYSTVMVVIVATLLALAALGLQKRQAENELNEKKQSILLSLYAGDAVKQGVPAEELIKSVKYDEVIDAYVVDKEGNRIEGENVFALLNDLPGAYEAGKFPLFEAKDGRVVIPVTGMGLWGPVWGYVALEKDMNTMAGIIMAHKGETPGLGAEIASTHFQGEFSGKKTLENGEVVLGVVKNGKVEKPDYQVDGISGGTITSVGVDAMLKACLSSYKNFLTNNNEEE